MIGDTLPNHLFAIEFETKLWRKLNGAYTKTGFHLIRDTAVLVLQFNGEAIQIGRLATPQMWGGKTDVIERILIHLHLPVPCDIRDVVRHSISLFVRHYGTYLEMLSA